MRCGLKALSTTTVRFPRLRGGTSTTRNTAGTAQAHPVDRSESAEPASMASQEDLPPVEGYSDRWEQQFWGKEGGLKPGEFFDGAGPSPALTTLLSSGRLQLAGKRVFIPGCGRGYDLPEFLKFGAEQAVGLELVLLAKQAADEYLDGVLAGEDRAKAQVFAGDFFKWQHPSVASFDVGYDYTFFCAMHPDMRRDWARAWARHLQPGARLICLAFPLNPANPVGPPWPVTVQLYRDCLEPHGFVCELEEPVPPEKSHPRRGGHECMLVFRRE